MEESILYTIKKLIGYDPEYTQFDLDLMIHINTCLNTLTQLGIGPEEGFVIHGATEIWSDFLQNDSMLEMVKTYIYAKVKSIYDPPTSSAGAEALNKTASELEWRLNVQSGV